MIWIKEIVRGLIEIYGTRNVYELLERLEITLVRKKLIHNEKGRFLRDIFGNETIFVSNELSDEEEIIVIAHELGHLILHTHLTTSYYTESCLLNKNKLETQANKFSAELLIPDDIEISEEQTIHQLSRQLNVTENLIILKFKKEGDLY